jgi:hypothetical protein
VWRSEASFLANLWQGRVINQRGGWLAKWVELGATYARSLPAKR